LRPVRRQRSAAYQPFTSNFETCARQVRLAAVEATSRGGRARVVVDRLQRGADGGLLDDRAADAQFSS
jgi:hypothetical protein